VSPSLDPPHVASRGGHGWFKNIKTYRGKPLAEPVHPLRVVAHDDGDVFSHETDKGLFERGGRGTGRMGLRDGADEEVLAG
jgi:hypothetical protein